MRTGRGSSVSDWQFVEFGAWMPDQPPLLNPGMTSAKNIFPKRNGYYGPVREPAVRSANTIAAAGGAPIRGSGEIYSFFDVPNTDNLHFVGSAGAANGDSRLYLSNDSTNQTWTDVSRPGGYDVRVGNTGWYFDSFGTDIIAASRSAPMQSYDTAAGGTFTDIPNAPRAIDIATVGEFLVAINTIDTAYGEGTRPYRVGWSAQGDALNWPQPFTPAAINVRSDIQDLFGGGRLLRIVPGIGGADAIIIGERRIWRMHRTGGADIFRFDPVEFDGGTHVSGSVVAYNEMVFFYNNGFQLFNGTQQIPIGIGAVDEFVAADIQNAPANGNARAVCGGIDGENSVVAWSYRSRHAETDFNDRTVFYNWQTKKWGLASIGFDVMGRVGSDLGSFDDPVLAVLDQTQRLKFFSESSGTTLDAELETKEASVGKGRMAEVKGIRPVIDSDVVLAQAATRDRISQAPIYTAATTAEDDGVVPVHDEHARYFRSKCTVPAGEEWTDALGCEFEVTPVETGPGRAG